MSRTLFVSREDKVKVGRLVNGVEDGEDGTAGVAKNMFYAMSEHHFVEDLAAREADEGVI